MSSASSSSNSDENVTASSNNQSSSDYSSSANENFFSLSEDTPHNTPLKTIPLNNSSTPMSTGKAVSVDLFSPSSASSNTTITSNQNNGINSTTRIRKLSNSSIASDVSFRLPHYDHQPVR